MSISIDDNKKIINIRLSTGNSIQRGNSSVEYNRIKLVLNSPLILPKKSYVALASLSIPYSWNNITTAFDNNSFSYVINNQTRVITLPEGSYQYQDFQDYLETQMFANGDYLLDSDGTPVYFIKIELNPIYYSLTITCKKIPSVLPSGWSNPSGLSLSASTPQLIVPNTNIQNYLGFSAGTYPVLPATSDYYVNSNSTPIVSVVSSVLIKCNMSNNFGYSNPINALYDFTCNSGSFGNQIEIRPTNLLWNPCISDSLNYVEVELCTQSNVPLVMKDVNNIVCNLSVIQG